MIDKIPARDAVSISASARHTRLRSAPMAKDRPDTDGVGDKAKPKRKKVKAEGLTKAERKQKRGARPTAAGAEKGKAREGGIEWRLARIEEAVETQSKRSKELLERVDAMLRDA